MLSKLSLKSKGALLFILFMVGFISLKASSPLASELPGLVSKYSAEGDAVDSVGGNNGVLLNEASFAPGRFGQAFSFDGVDDVVQLPNAANLNFYETSPMTVEMWVYRTGGAAVMHLLGKRELCNNDFQYQLAFDSGGLVFGGLGFDGGYIRAQGVQLPLNMWTHVAGTFDGNTLRLYVDGQSVWTGAGSLGPVNSAPVLIGGTGTCEHFAGLLDEVKIFNRALSAAEIQAEANSETPTPTATPTPSPTVTPTPPICGTGQAQIQTYDLATDWSNTSNPNGVWSYNEGSNPLPFQPEWEPSFGPAWAYAPWPNFGHVPLWAKTQVSSSVDGFEIGDILGHSSDSGRGENYEPANITWTSPSAGNINISGSAWISPSIDRSNRWELYLNGTLLSSGNMLAQGGYYRSNPFSFSAGSGGAPILNNIPVSAGDVVKLQIVKLSTFGHFVGVNLQITLSNCAPIDTAPPVITCPTNISVAGNIPGSCSATVNPGAASATDNSATVTVAGVRSDNQQLDAPYPLGTTTITWTATDAAGNQSSCQQLITVSNPSPTVTITGPPSGAIYVVGTSINFTGTFTDNPGGTHSATWIFDNITQSASVVEPYGSMPGSANTTFTVTNSGVYLIRLVVDDGCGGTGLADTVDGITAMVVVYDPNGGYVTGGGWINSPVGAYQPDPSLTGKANFGFVSRYQHGAAVPTGQTEFQFKIANLNFHSTVYEWLVVAGARAQFKGTGTINGVGNYGFLITAIDGSVTGSDGIDRFRIKIWDKNNTDALVYDNKLGASDNSNNATELGGGSIIIHQ